MGFTTSYLSGINVFPRVRSYFRSTARHGALFALLLLTGFISPLPAIAIDFCEGGVLDRGAPLGQEGPDLVITNMTCTVDGTQTPYNFHNVYILGNGTLTFNNGTMDFYAANILVQNQGILKATGIGENNGGQVLTIHLYGSESEPDVSCKKLVNGSLVNDFTCGVPTSDPDVWNSNKMNMRDPTSCNKTSQLMPPTRLPGGVDDCFYQYDDSTAQGAYFGHKVLALSYSGTINLSGYKGAQGGDDSNPAVTGSSWMRLNATLKGGEGSLNLDSMPTDWKPNDYIVVTSTDYLPGHAEQLQISSVSGSTINLVGPVAYPHWGRTYSLKDVPCNAPMGSTACDIGPDLLPGQTADERNIDTRAAVGLLSRSIRIVSDGATAGSPLTGYFGGHTILRQGFLSYQVQGVEFYQLGQGGSKGRYPVHFHMVRLTPDNTYVKDSSMWDSMTRWITLHATQNVTLARNVGYKSIGHGFYLEDGTETDNSLRTNLGVFARAAVNNVQNDRKVPGILASPDRLGEEPPYHSDWDHPTVFWIMNGWNDFEYNFASSAGTCGACYWLLPGGISGPSQFEHFEGYAGQQMVGQQPGGINRAGLSPLQKFVGNSCSTAMSAFINVGATTPCSGVGNSGNAQELQAIRNTKAPNKGTPGRDRYYPFVTGLRNPTLCTGTNCGTNQANPPCAGFGPDQANCVVTTIDRFTTSYNWAHKNFAAVWLRPWWFLVQNSAITDVQQGGLTFVTSGGYTRADVAVGYWSLLRKSVLVGKTQPAYTGTYINPFTSNGGPFNPDGLKCDVGPPNQRAYCLSRDQGISYPIDAFSVNQKLFNIYDGPAFQERNAYLDVTETHIGNSANCTGDQVEQFCPSFNWLYGNELGLPADPSGPSEDRSCYLPNAAIAWKQSNGFFYPPAFHSDNLYFRNVGIRHFVIEPLFEYGTFGTDPNAIKKRYCTWRTDMFKNFSDVDRQTVLNDDDGSLTGLLAQVGNETRETISVNEDPFFNAPKVTVECASDIHDLDQPATGPPGTANTSPYEYVTTATIADCGINRQGCPQGSGMDSYQAWGADCTAASPPQGCYGVPLYREYLTDTEYANYQRDSRNFKWPVIRMMGQDTGQRSTLTVNHGLYYIDDQVKRETQQRSGATNLNVYLPGHTYYVYFIYAKPSLEQTYQMYLPTNLTRTQVEALVHQFRTTINTQNYVFNPAGNDLKFVKVTGWDQSKGIVSINVNLSAYASEFTKDTPNFCQPRSYCAPKEEDMSKCGCAPGTECTDDSVCSWGISDIDCPLKGCFAFGITLPADFETGVSTTPPAPLKFTDDPNYANDWGIPFSPVKKGISGAQCFYSTPPYEMR